MENHKYTLYDLENMIPWERDVYISLLIEDLKAKNEQAKQRQQ
jgi:hypothetical protein